MAKKIKMQYYEGIGRRKEATARVRLYIVDKKEVVIDGVNVKKGEIMVNKSTNDIYFPRNLDQMRQKFPLVMTGNEDRFAISIYTRGGGKAGQLEACILGFARALQIADSSHHPALKKEGLLTRDARERERRKVGTGGKARRKKQSPKR